MPRVPPVLIALALTPGSWALAFDTIGNGYGSKWGADPAAGTGAIVTWGYMLDSTDVDPNFRIDPFTFPDISGVVGTSNVTELRDLIDTNHGAGTFDAAIQRAFDTWSAVANITFVGPVLDSGLDVDSPNAVYPNIRIGAFQPDPNHWFKDAGAIGFGPPGPPNDIRNSRSRAISSLIWLARRSSRHFTSRLAMKM